VIDEMKVAVHTEREKLSKQSAELQKERDQLEQYRKLKQEENLGLKRQTEDQSFSLKETQQSLEVLQERYAKLDSLSKGQASQIEQLTKDLHAAIKELEKTR